MKEYDFLVFENNGYKVGIIFSTNFISPIKSISELQTKHKEELANCEEVYFDFLLSTRNSSERFAKAPCTNGVIDMDQFSYINVRRKELLRKVSSEFYKKNLDDFDWTYADPIKRKLIARGLII